MYSVMGVVLPPDIIVAIQALVAAGAMVVVSEGIKAVLAWIHVDLSGAAAGITATLVGIVMAVIVGLVGQIPDQWSPLVIELIKLALLLLAGFGLYRMHSRALKAKLALLAALAE